MNMILNEYFDKSIHFLDSPFEYKLKTRFFANNTLDMVMTKIKHKRQVNSASDAGYFGVSYSKTLSDVELERKRLENLERAVRRARQAVHFACRQINADHMLTLNVRENIQDKQQFFSIYTRFIRLVREKDFKIISGKKYLITRQEKRNWNYVAVPELQERGAYHMHVACTGKQDLELLRSCWYIALGGSIDDVGHQVLGQIDVQSHKKRFSGYSETHKTFSLVRYLTKYISKGFEESTELGQHRYKVSRHIRKPTEQNQNLIASFSYGGQGFVDAIKEVLSISEFIGVSLDYELWNRGEDVFILRGTIND